MIFFIKETTSGSKKKIYGPYKGTFKKYEKPVIVERKDGSKIKHTIYPSVYKLKNKVTMQKGGTHSINLDENPLKSLDDGINEQNFNKVSKALDIFLRQNPDSGINTIIDDEYGKNTLFMRVLKEIDDDRLGRDNDFKTEIIKLLLNKNPNIEIKNSDKLTPLMYCIRFKWIEIVQLLLDYGARLDVTDNKGNSPFIAAVMGGDVNLTKLLLDNRAHLITSIINNSSSLSRDYAKKNSIDYGLIIAAGTDVRDNVEDVRDNVEMVKLLLDRGARIDIMNNILDKRTPLEMAINSNNIEVVNLLFERGADISSGNLHNLVIRTFENPNRRNKIIPIVNLLLNKADEKGLGVNFTNEFGDTILGSYIASCIYHPHNFDINIIQLLLDRGANIDFQGKSGNTYLMNMIKMINLRHYANSIIIIQSLLERGADINLPDKSGKTPLMIAFERKNIEIVELLLNQNSIIIDPVIKNKLNLNNSDSVNNRKRKILSYFSHN